MPLASGLSLGAAATAAAGDSSNRSDVYLVGGVSDGSSRDDVWVLAASSSSSTAGWTTEWRAASGDMSTARWGHALAYVDGDSDGAGAVFALGGRAPSGVALSSVERYDIATSAWASAPPMPTARWSHR